jgi:putative chitinase
VIVSAEQLQRIMPFATGKIPLFLGPLNDAMDEFGITTYTRQAAFLAQVAHESGELRYVLELADGSAYEGRKDLGNIFPGDGPAFRGRGLLQITGRNNYISCGGALGLSLVEQPSLLETPAGASRSAAWFWKLRGLNTLADLNHFGSITKTINGAYNGLDERIIYWLRARNTFGL